MGFWSGASPEGRAAARRSGARWTARGGAVRTRGRARAGPEREREPRGSGGRGGAARWRRAPPPPGPGRRRRGSRLRRAPPPFPPPPAPSPLPRRSGRGDATGGGGGGSVIEPAFALPAAPSPTFGRLCSHPYLAPAAAGPVRSRWKPSAAVPLGVPRAHTRGMGGGPRPAPSLVASRGPAATPSFLGLRRRSAGGLGSPSPRRRAQATPLRRSRAAAVAPRSPLLPCLAPAEGAQAFRPDPVLRSAPPPAQGVDTGLTHHRRLPARVVRDPPPPPSSPLRL